MLQIIREVGKFVQTGKKSYDGNFILKLIPNQMEVERV